MIGRMTGCQGWKRDKEPLQISNLDNLVDGGISHSGDRGTISKSWQQKENDNAW